MEAPFAPAVSDKSSSEKIDEPHRRDIGFVRGNRFDDGPFFFEGKVWTNERPLDGDGLPMFHSSEEVPEDVADVSETELVAPWDRHYWFSEIRGSYLSTVRYFNGWVPWYGTRPNAQWYKASSLGGQMRIIARYNPERGGTEVFVFLPSNESQALNPGSRYRYDVESARPDRLNDEGDAMSFTDIRTWLHGNVRVSASWTMNTPIDNVPRRWLS